MDFNNRIILIEPNIHILPYTQSVNHIYIHIYISSILLFSRYFTDSSLIVIYYVLRPLMYSEHNEIFATANECRCLQIDQPCTVQNYIHLYCLTQRRNSHAFSAALARSPIPVRPAVDGGRIRNIPDRD